MRFFKLIFLGILFLPTLSFAAIVRYDLPTYSDMTTPQSNSSDTIDGSEYIGLTNRQTSGAEYFCQSFGFALSDSEVGSQVEHIAY